MQEQTLFEQKLSNIRNGADVAQEAQQLYDSLTEEERLRLLDGDTPFWEGMQSFVDEGYNVRPYVHGAIERLGIPGTRFIDGPRGCVMGKATAFPVSMARGATWDPELEERVGQAIGEEVREMGGNFFGGVCINLPRHPAWGRVQETYSDQPLILGAMGSALSRGVQHNAMACMKHFALNSMENARFSVDVQVDDATLHEVYVPHFKKVAESGVQAVMSSYNSVNGQWAGQNHQLLQEILRDEWHYDGMSVSDFIWGLRDAAQSINNGLDIEEPFAQQRAAHLREAISQGTVTWDTIREHGTRILRNELRYYSNRDAQEPQGTILSKAHTDLAREVADRSVVLLRNELVDGKPVLPLDPSITSVTVFGKLANTENTGDHGSSDVHSEHVVTPLEGLQSILGQERVNYCVGDDLDEAANAASNAETAIVVVGFTAADEGEFVDGSISSREDLLALYPEPQDEDERVVRDAVLTKMNSGYSVVGSETMGGDRRDLHLHNEDVALINTVARNNPRTIVVVVSAGAVMMEDWHTRVPALVLGWYSGCEGGNALADVLFGKANPSGRLPYPIPATETDLPYLDIDATSITYDRYYGQRLIQRNGSQALYPLGFGLAYTTYALDDVTVSQVDRSKGTALATVQVSNTGMVDGYHVVQLYGTLQSTDRAGERELLGFCSVKIPAGKQRTVDVELDLTAIGRWNAQTRQIEVPEGDLCIEASSYWGDEHGVRTEVTL